MSPSVPVKIILGTHTVGSKSEHPGIVHFDTAEEVRALLDAFYSRGHRELDTARNYPGSEERLGLAGAPSRFLVHTKVRDGAGTTHPHEPAQIAQSIDKSLSDLGTASVETMYLHVPDRTTPFEDTARAIDEGFRQGKYKRFGLSNYSEEEVQRFLDICEEKGYVKPSLFQGHYNPLVRGNEKALFPLLRKHDIAFYAYSPAAAGIFRSDADKYKTARWKDDNQIGAIYSAMYGKPAVAEAVDVVRDAAEKHGISGHAAALRWTAFHSILDGKYGDGIIFGVSNLNQLKQTLDAIDAGPLPAELAKAIDSVWTVVDGQGPPYYI
ncbi:Aldo/keto reductase [Daldinia caldariorum]|uniref:Aldo/keto reductase n=1 Tax=Daldinia caldariorum TaxID=326644 RepID=UPI0020075793|nr:Aldo/keto reductase [Daldinia caldariorum]KAI1463213.1 Aldo/keto reductase [Daldinia caldariorum]